MDVIRRLCDLAAVTLEETPVGLPIQQEAGCAPAQSANIAEK